MSGGATWPNGSHGLCGDPASAAAPRSLEAGGAAYTGAVGGQYSQGAVLTAVVAVTAFHQGRFGLRVCRVPGAPDAAAEPAALTEACLDANVLVQAGVAGAQAPGQRWYYLGTVPPAVAPASYTSYWQLPPGLTCDGTTAHCVLQWYW